MNVNPNSIFSKDKRITVIDKTGSRFSEVKEAFESSLIANGFNLISESVSRESKIINNKINLNASINQKIEEYRTKEIKSDYAIEIKYRGYTTIATVLRNFSATVIDLETGNIVVSATFSGDRPMKEVFRKLISEINSKLNN